MSTKPLALSWSKKSAELAPRINSELAPEGTTRLGNGPLFWVCMTVGFAEGARGEASSDQDVGRIPEIISPETRAAAYAIALDVLGIDSWADEGQVLKLAEEFAAGGLDILAAKLDDGVREWVAEFFYPAVSAQLSSKPD